MTDYGYQQYGEDFWPTISRVSASNTFRFFPFEKAMYNTTGMRFQAWHDRSIEAQLKAWRAANQEKASSDVTVIYEDKSPFPARINSPVLTPNGHRPCEAAEQISEPQPDAPHGLFHGSAKRCNIAADDRFVVWDAFAFTRAHFLRYSDLCLRPAKQYGQRLSRKEFFSSGTRSRPPAGRHSKYPTGSTNWRATPSAGGIQDPDAIIPVRRIF